MRRPIPEPDVDLAWSFDSDASEYPVHSNDRNLTPIGLGMPAIAEAIDHCQDAGEVGIVFDPDFIRRQVKLAEGAGWLRWVRIRLGLHGGLHQH